jgi:hypothetical protein
MTDDIIRKATTADYIETIDNLRAEVERLRSDIFHRKEHLFVNAFPDGGYAMRILQSYRDLCDEYVSDNITGGPTNPLCIAINEANEKRKLELDKAISNLGSIAAKDARIKELEEMIRQLGSLAFMGDMPLDQIVAHFIAWGQSNYDYTSRLEAAFLEAEEQRLAFCKNFNHDPKDRWVVVDMDGERMEAEAREALERIKEGGKDE